MHSAIRQLARDASIVEAGWPNDCEMKARVDPFDRKVASAQTVSQHCEQRATALVVPPRHASHVSCKMSLGNEVGQRGLNVARSAERGGDAGALEHVGQMRRDDEVR
ncbi:MAG: hypothetical protein IAI49_07350, partial [Candidatus Eremiobacteraeota bacterium]|nr:hypothetical protein [Candidatus Eremiobacteraeota bacterium]